MSADAEYLTAEQVEARYHVRQKSLTNMRWLSRGPAYSRFGRRILYRRADVESYLAARKVTPQEGAENDCG